MVLVKKEGMKAIAPLFEGWNETLIWSCLQGCMGRAWADDKDNPSSCQIIVGDFCFLAGDSTTKSARELVSNIPQDYNSSCLLVIPRDETWYSLIEEIYNGRVQRFIRYAIKKESSFNRERLLKYVASLPKGYTILPIDKELYNKVMSEGWSRDFCSQFEGYESYHDHGLGYVVVYEGEVVCGASSYTYYNEGIEVEICTKSEHRRRGLALACASQLILSCLDRGLYPSWDAANLGSVELAKKLGYSFDHEYVTFEVTGINR